MKSPSKRVFRGLWTNIKDIQRSSEEQFRLNKNIKDHLLMCLRTDECFYYLGSLCFKHHKITVTEYEQWWKWWKNHKQKIVKSEKSDEEKDLYEQAETEFAQEIAKQAEIDRELKLKDIPF